MTIELANKLTKLRKEHGYTQEELASKLNVSRQAISKWERGEASPDTDNLIELAKLYNISLDELILIDSEKKEGEETEKSEETKAEKVTSDFASKESKRHFKFNLAAPLLAGILSSVLFVLITVLYLTFGYLYGSYQNNLVWKCGWIAYFLIPIMDSIFECAYNKKISDLNGAMILLTVGAYLLVGFLTNTWHPTWAMFLFIPSFCGLSSGIDKYIDNKRQNKDIVDEAKDDE